MSAAISSRTNAPAQSQTGSFSYYFIWFGLVAFQVFARFLLGVMNAPLARLASEFAWSTIALYGTLGLGGIWLARRVGFPDAWDTRVSARSRLALPLLLGAALGLVAVLIDSVTAGTKFIESQTGQASFNVAFPASLLVYTSGIVSVEVFYRLVPLPLLLWIISSLLLRGRAQDKVFLGLAVVLSLLEPAVQGLGILFLKPTADPLTPFVTLFLPYFVTNYPLNLGEALFWRKYGYLAAFALRLGFYLMWHIVYGNLIYR